MSLLARKRASLVRGMTMAEHGVYHRLCSYHNVRHADPFPKISTLCFQFECSKIYMRQILRDLSKKRFLKRKKRFIGFGEDGPQDANAYEIDLTRWFPYKDEESERANNAVLGYFRRSIADAELSHGFLATWIEPKRSRSKRQRRNLWIAVESLSTHKFLRKNFDAIMKKIKEETGNEYNLRELRTYESDE